MEDSVPIKKSLNPTEHETQKAILEYLKLKGHLCWRNNTGASVFPGSNGKKYFVRYGLPGSGDILGVRKGTGQFISIEVKRKGGSLTDTQMQFMNDVVSKGGKAIVAYSVDDVVIAGL